jgi:flavin reductase (DIM6/NTAB) family NADH-FMN oxidoreductase RutF
MDLKAADPQEVQELVARSQGIVVGMPPTTGEVANLTQGAIGTIFVAAKAKQTIGLYESYGGDDEPIDTMLNRFREIGLSIAFPAIRVKDTPSETTYQNAEEAGTDLGQFLTKAATIKQMKSLDSELDKALGRLSGGLYVITAQKGDSRSAMLASWVTQASFEPLGLTIAVANDRAIDSLMQVGDKFVLNVLPEGAYQPLMKHFLKRFPPGADRFEGVKTQVATNGSPILQDALAYIECEVSSRMACGDHHIVYATVNDGRVGNPDGLTAVHHRRVGNHY